MRPLHYDSTFTVRTDADLRAAIAAAAAREGSTPSTWIRNALAAIAPVSSFPSKRPAGQPAGASR